MYDYKSYLKARDLAWNTLIKYEIADFPVNLPELISKTNIQLVTYGNAKDFLKMYNIKNKDAFALSFNINKYIFFNEAMYFPRQRFNIAHELGHIAHKHLKDNELLIPTQVQEYSADAYAARLLMPAIVAKHEGLHTPSETMQFFGVSGEAALIRSHRIEELIERDKFLASPLEVKYYEIYKEAHKRY